VFDSPRCTMLQLEERSGKGIEDVKHRESNQRSRARLGPKALTQAVLR
jgi:hypothetical protein